MRPQLPLSKQLQMSIGIHWPGWTTVVVRVVAFLLLVVLTALSFWPIVEEYRFRNVAVQIAIVNNGTIPKPNVTVCLPYHGGALKNVTQVLSKFYRENISLPSSDIEALGNHSWDVWTSMNRSILAGEEDIYQVRSAIASTMIRKLFDDVSLEDVLTLNKTNFNWNQPIFDALWLFFSCILKIDIKFFGSNIDTYACGFDLTDTYFMSKQNMNRLWEKALESADLYIHSTYNPLENMSESLESKFVDRAALKIFGDYFCFPTMPSSFREAYRLQSHEKTVDPPWIRFSRAWEYIVVPDETILYKRLYRYDLLYKTSSSTPDIVSEEVNLAYGISTRVIEARPKFKKVCSSEPNPVVCAVQRQVQHVVQKCNCVPFSFRHFLVDEQSDLPYCNKTFYKSCDKEKLTNLEKRLQTCDNKCEQILYSWQQNNQIDTGKGEKRREFQLFMKPVKSVFMEFTTDIKDTSEKFLSQFGGLVNLYLGVSGLSVCAFLLFCVDAIKRWRKLTTEGSSQEKATETERNAIASELSGVKSQVISMQANLDSVCRDLRMIKEMLVQRKGSISF